MAAVGLIKTGLFCSSMICSVTVGFGVCFGAAGILLDPSIVAACLSASSLLVVVIVLPVGLLTVYLECTPMTLSVYSSPIYLVSPVFGSTSYFF